MVQNGIIIFFYVDDIVFAYRKAQEKEARALMAQLQQRYRLTGGDTLQWFLGIEIIRDREKCLIWLSQSDYYFDKIANLIDTKDKTPTHPMKKEELLPYEGRATGASINRYQRKVGSILYAAVVTRLDVAFAASRLARFNMNPGPEHHKAADQVLNYLQGSKALALQLGGEDSFVVSSDASFADNSLDRKSSQAYVMKLFGGVIGWRANKQTTVSTSTTEAELLALSQAAKESLFVSRLLKELDVRLDDHRIRILCDNTQTINIVTREIGYLRTKLRHVDIHNHWLRQEVKEGRITVEYISTDDMVADGLTKVLTNTSFRRFVDQVGLVDVNHHLQERKLRDLTEEDLEIMAGDF
jgi:hypothetical protein